MKIKYTIVLLAYFLCNLSLAQEMDYWPGLLQNIEEYQQKLLQSDTLAIEKFRNTLRTWQRYEPDTTKLLYFISQIHYSCRLYKIPFELIQRDLRKKTNDSKLSLLFTEQEAANISSASSLLLLILDQLLDLEYPYQVNPIFLKQELEFYELDENETIAEIGAGFGEFSILLSMTGLNLTIYVNELQALLLEYIENMHPSNFMNGDKVFIIHGKMKKVNIPEKVDKIIIRNSLHHFKKMKQMLKSIKKTLKKDGELYIKEYPKQSLKNDCQFKMTEREIQQKLTKAGFEIVESKKILEAVLYKLKSE